MTWALKEGKILFRTWKETCTNFLSVGCWGFLGNNVCFLIYDNFIILEKILWKRSGMKMEKLFKICVNPWFFYFFFLQVQRTFLELLHYYYNFLWREKTGRLLGRIKYRESSCNAVENSTLKVFVCYLSQACCLETIPILRQQIFKLFLTHPTSA